MNSTYADLLSEFQAIEDRYYAIPRASLPFSTLYLFLLDKVEEYIAKSPKSTQESDLLKHLGTAILIRVLNTKNNANTSKILNPKNYFASLERHLKRFENSIVDVSTYVTAEMNESTIKQLILQMTKLVGETIPSLVDKLSQQIDEKIRSISDEASVGPESIKVNELVAQLTSKAAVGMMKTTSMCAALFSPIEVLDSMEIRIMWLGNDKDELARMAKNATSFMSNYYKSEQDNLKMQFKNPKINSTRVEFARNIEQFKNIFDKTVSLREMLDRNVTSNIYLEQKLETKKLLRDYQTQLIKTKNELEKKPDRGSATGKNTEENNNVLLEWVAHVQGAIIAADLGIESVQLTNNLVSALGNRITEVDDEITQIKEYEYQIKNSTTVQNETIAQGTANSYSQRYLNLDKSKQKLENIIKGFESKTKSMIRKQPDAYVKSTLNYYIDKLSNAMSTMVKVYDRIQDYRDHQSLHRYIETITWTKIKHTEANQKLIDDLVFTIKSNLVMLEYEKAFTQFKLYVFPYADKYRGHFNISSYLVSKNITALVTDAIKEVVEMKEIFSNTTQSINTIPIDVKFAPGVEPQNEISKLLRGEQVLVEVDIRRDQHQSNAIKFNDIGLRFVLANISLQKELDEKLVDLEVEMIHLGDSQYKCNDQFYEIDHDKVLLAHSATKKKGHSGEISYQRANNEVELVREFNPVLSPYATWAMKVYAEPGFNLAGLKKFTNEKIDLVLDARGSYVELNSTACEGNNLEKYYNLNKRSEDVGPIENHRRKRQLASNNTSTTEGPSSNSGNLLTSPINAAFKLLGGVLGYATNYNGLKVGIQSMFGQLSHEFNAQGIPKGFDSSAASGAKFNIYETLTLADFFIRWVTKVEPCCYSMEDPMNSSEVKAYALNMIEGIEEIFEEIKEQFNLAVDSLEFDPVTLMVNLEKEIVNRNYAKIENILYDVIGNNSYSEDPQFNIFAKDKIHNLLR